MDDEAEGLKRYTFTIDEETSRALDRLAEHEMRTRSKTILFLIRSDALRKGLWTPQRPEIVKSKAN